MNVKTALLSVVGCASLFSCSNDDVYNPNWAKEQYASNFESEFGKIDPLQTWNTATSRTVNVSVSYGGDEDYTIRIYTSDPYSAETQAYLLAEYGMKDGETQALAFDAPATLQNFYVSRVNKDGYSVTHAVAVDDLNVTFGGKTGATTRTVSYIKRVDNDLSTENGMSFKESDIQKVRAVFGEGRDNRENVSFDFHINSGTIRVYPVYSSTAAKEIVGVYDIHRREQTCWNNNTGIAYGAIKRRKGTTGAWEDYDNKQDPFVVDEKDGLKYTEVWSEKYTTFDISEEQGNSLSFWITNTPYTYYSDKAMNTFDNKEHAAAIEGVTVNGQECLFIGFEDSYNYGVDADFDDVVICVVGDYEFERKDEPAKPAKPMEYLIAYEDLGDTDDFDFNDIVLSVSHVSGATTATVKLLAAGGSLPTHVSYGNQALFDGKEVHDAFGVPVSTMVNTGNYTYTGNEIKTEITVPTDFSMTKNGSEFKISVVQKGGEQTDIMLPSHTGVAPQAFVVSDPNWEWPSERVKITEKYPAFKDWIQSMNAGGSWYEAEWK